MADEKNPFAGPFGPGGPFTDNLTDPAAAANAGCPRCGARDWDVRNTPQHTLLVCRKCGEKWSKGTMAVGRPDLTQPPPPKGVAALEEDPGPQYTGADFRDPRKNFDWGGEE